MASHKVITVTNTLDGADDAGFPQAFRSLGCRVVNLNAASYMYTMGHYLGAADASFLERAAFRLTRRARRETFNAQLLRTIRAFTPNILFLFKGQEVAPEVVAEAVRVGARVYFFYPDLDPTVHGQAFLESVRTASGFFHTKPNLAAHMRAVIRPDAEYIPPLFDEQYVAAPDEVRPEASAPCVVLANYSPQKETLLQRLDPPARIPIHVYGAGWSNAAKRIWRRVAFFPALYGAPAFEKIRAAAFSIGLLQERFGNAPEGDVITSRTVLVPAYGGLILHPNNEAALTLLGAPDALFASFEDLLDRMRRAEDWDTRRSWAQQQHASVIAQSMSVQAFAKRLLGDWG
jgi:hypothetical protein